MVEDQVLVLLAVEVVELPHPVTQKYSGLLKAGLEIGRRCHVFTCIESNVHQG